jgi:hypothetical protein
LLRWLLFAVVMTALPVTAGVVVLGDDAPPESPPPTPPSYASTSLVDYDTSVVALTRAPFCNRIPREAVTEALGGESGTRSSYRNGQSAELAPGIEDVAHEYGCQVVSRGADGGELRAWLFAPPITRSRATDLVDELADRPSCRRDAGAPAYGAPSLALVCPDGDRRWASFRGLFGDAWLACSLAAPKSVDVKELVDRAGRWCVAVAEAAATR